MEELQNRVRLMNLSIVTKLYLAMTVVGIALLVITLTYSIRHERGLVDELALQQAEAFGQSYFEAINTLMVSGAMSQRDLLHSKMLALPNIRELRIIRSSKISELYGAGTAGGQPEDALDRRALEGVPVTRKSTNDGEAVLTILRPLVMTQNYSGINCLSCHPTNKEGDIGGAVRVTYSLQEANQKITRASWTQAGLMGGVFAFGIFVLVMVFRRYVATPLKGLNRKLKQAVAKADLSESFATGRDDELGEVTQSMDLLISQFRDTLGQLAASSRDLNETADQLSLTTQETESVVVKLKDDTNAVAVSLNQMDATAHDVNQTAQHTTERSSNASELAESGAQEMSQVVENIKQLVAAVKQTESDLETLKQQSEDVGAVVQVIESIADMTNLLALNAAIEAARAGEHGRGFAVVADEVRSLATRTQSSTAEIAGIIERLRSQTEESVNAMEQVDQQALNAADEIAALSEHLRGIAESSEEISQLNLGVTEATSQQAEVADSVNQHIEEIRLVAERSAQNIHRSNAVSEKMVSLSNHLDELVKRYKTAPGSD